MEQKTFIRIPKERVGALIGPGGKTKKRIEATFQVDLTIDSETGNVDIVVKPDQPDVSVLFVVRNVVRAVGRGFSPKNALTLINEDFDLIIMDLEEYVGKSKNAQNRVKGRIIGKEGKSRAMIEELTDCLVSVYGGTVSIIGPFDMLSVSKEAVEMLINGSFHKTVWNHLYAYRRKMKKEKGELWYEPARRRETN
ncbi:MAG: KH domain-containing protein [Candidatus Bathyarchaeota archaeon]|nr:KH domain-containing protein [Candidatus Bathyarchaeota archaeon]